MTDVPNEKKAPEMEEKEISTDRRRFLQGAGVAAGMLGAVAIAPTLAQAAPQGEQQPKMESASREELRRDMMAGIEDDVKKDLELRGTAVEELPRPAGLKLGAMLDSRFPIYYKIAVPEAMRLATAYFAAMSDNDMAGVASTLHFPYATYEGTEPLVYRNAQEFISNPPPSMNMHAGKESQRRPGTYDILNVLQLQSYNPVSVVVELCYTRYRADGYKIGMNQGVYDITNNDGKWGIQLSSTIFAPAEYIGQTYNDAVEAYLRSNRTSMVRFGDKAWELFPGEGNARGDGGMPAGTAGAPATAPRRKTAGLANDPEAQACFLSAWAGKPMEPYNSKGRMSRLQVRGFADDAAINAMQGTLTEYTKADNAIAPTNIATSKGQEGWFYEMVGSDVGHYGYTWALNDTKVIHAGPEKAHGLSGYMRYTPDHVLVSETHRMGILVFDLRTGTWGQVAGLGSNVVRDRGSDELI